jgi:hypothetical protein
LPIPPANPSSAAFQKTNHHLENHHCTMDHLIEQCAGIASSDRQNRKFQIVIIYENVVSAARALRACEILRNEIPQDLTLQINVWKMGSLEVEENRTLAASASAMADVVIVSASGRDEAPAAFRSWVDSWLWLCREHRCALFTLFGDHVAPDAVALAGWLQRKTAPRGIDFFTHPPLDGRDLDLFRDVPLGLPAGPVKESLRSTLEEWRPSARLAGDGDVAESALDIIENFGAHLRARLEEVRIRNMADVEEESWSPSASCARDNFAG